MSAGLLIKMAPTGPWRIGPASGERGRAEDILHSDALYGAVCSAMLRLGLIEEWLDATARATVPEVCLSSCFPYQGDTLYVTPPRTLWPPASSGRLRWKGAKFVPLAVVKHLVEGRAISEDAWAIDVASQCLTPISAAGRPGPFKTAVRSSAGVDRAGGDVAPHSTACLEFSSGAGLWCVMQFSSDEAKQRWSPNVSAAFRLLADSGIGGGRSRGWGHFESPQISEGRLPGLILSSSLGASAESESSYWLLSVFQPSTEEPVDWTRGDYVLCSRSGRAESCGAMKPTVRMVAEGSVLVSKAPPVGAATALDMAGSEHPIYRAAFAVSIPLPQRAPAKSPSVTAPTDEEKGASQ